MSLLTLMRSTTMKVATLLKRLYDFVRRIPPSLEDERTFLTYQIDLRESGTRVLNEAMLVLDIIDVKTQSLLSYISISLAALVFLITSLPSSQNLKLLLLSQKQLTAALLLIILSLLTAIIICLTCLNIVGAHTIKSLKSQLTSSKQAYEDHIVRVSLGRRNRYLIAHRISVLTAVGTVVVFAWLLLSSVVAP